MMNNHLGVGAATCVVCLVTTGALAQESGPSKQALRADGMEQLHRMIGPAPGNYRWDEVPWFASLWHARRKASADNKPILVFGTGGAGFNDPLGNC